MRVNLHSIFSYIDANHDEMLAQIRKEALELKKETLTDKVRMQMKQKKTPMSPEEEDAFISDAMQNAKQDVEHLVTEMTHRLLEFKKAYLASKEALSIVEGSPEEEEIKNKLPKYLLDFCQNRIRVLNAYISANRNIEAAEIFLDAHMGPSYFEDYLRLKPSDDFSLVPDIRIEGRDIDLDQNFYIARLHSENPIAAVIGKYTECCMTLDESFASYVKNCIEHSGCGYYVIFKKSANRKSKDTIIAQAAVEYSYGDMFFLSVQKKREYNKLDSMIAGFFLALAKELTTQHQVNNVIFKNIRGNLTPPALMKFRPLCKPGMNSASYQNNYQIAGKNLPCFKLNEEKTGLEVDVNQAITAAQFLELLLFYAAQQSPFPYDFLQALAKIKFGATSRIAQIETAADDRAVLSKAEVVADQSASVSHSVSEVLSAGIILGDSLVHWPSTIDYFREVKNWLDLIEGAKSLNRDELNIFLSVHDGEIKRFIAKLPGCLNLKLQFNESSMAALAFRSGNIEFMQYLKEHGAIFDEIVLCLGELKGDQEAFLWLINNTLAPVELYEGGALLPALAESGQWEVLKFLLDKQTRLINTQQSFPLESEINDPEKKKLYNVFRDLQQFFPIQNFFKNPIAKKINMTIRNISILLILYYVGEASLPEKNKLDIINPIMLTKQELELFINFHHYMKGNNLDFFTQLMTTLDDRAVLGNPKGITFFVQPSSREEPREEKPKASSSAEPSIKC